MVGDVAVGRVVEGRGVEDFCWDASDSVDEWGSPVFSAFE